MSPNTMRTINSSMLLCSQPEGLYVPQIALTSICQLVFMVVDCTLDQLDQNIVMDLDGRHSNFSPLPDSVPTLKPGKTSNTLISGVTVYNTLYIVR